MSQQRALLSSHSSRNDYCCVPKCSSWSRKNPDLSFHRFPHKGKERVYMEGRELVDRREAWIQRLNLGKPASKFMKVCSLHFTPSDYLQKDGNSGRGRVLKRTAVPSKKLPQTTTSPAPPPKISTKKRYLEKSTRWDLYQAFCAYERAEQELQKRMATSSKILPQTTSPAPTPKISSNGRHLEKSKRLDLYRAYCANQRSEQELVAAEALVQLLNPKSEIQQLIDKVALRTYNTSISL